MKKKELPFEEGLKRLEELVESLEERDLGLDKALAAFEEGLTLSAGLRKKLDDATGKMEILSRGILEKTEKTEKTEKMENSGKMVASPWEPYEISDDDDD